MNLYICLMHHLNQIMRIFNSFFLCSIYEINLILVYLKKIYIISLLIIILKWVQKT